MSVVAFRPNKKNDLFLSRIRGTKTEFINKALENYSIYLLRKNIREGFSLQDNNDLQLSNSGLGDYISIIEENEL